MSLWRIENLFSIHALAIEISMCSNHRMERQGIGDNFSKFSYSVDKSDFPLRFSTDLSTSDFGGSVGPGILQDIKKQTRRSVAEHGAMACG